MMGHVLIDRLLDLGQRRNKEIAEQWYKAISTSPRTPSCHKLPREWCLKQAESLYKELKDLYFCNSPYETVCQHLDNMGYAEYNYARGVPLNEAIYALILMRRHLWLYADMQAMYNTANDLFQVVESLNRTILLFDYAIYIVSQRYYEIKR